jgi:predicted RecB family nuclease
MSIESFFTRDELSVQKDEILTRLEKDGFSENVRQQVIEWRKKREEQAMALPTADKIVRLNYEMAQIYEYAGDTEEMFNSLYDVLQNAIQEGFTDLERMIRAKIEEMNKKYPPES